MHRFDRQSIAPVVVALVSGAAVLLVASTVFAYHSSNHDEGVYLMQAAMLLNGQLELSAGELAGAVRPWFFVEEGSRLYPKYSPVPAAMFAVSMGLFGEPRVTLAAVAAGNTALVYLLGRMLVDHRVGLVAAVVFGSAPLALVTTSVFLPYAPTTLLNLLFAVAYLRGLRDDSFPAAALAGLAIGLAFFARPLTAVLFATPFIVHALYRVGSAIRGRGPRPVPLEVWRQGLTAVLGLAFVGVTLTYNYRVTGSPLLFPYEAFAPLDGPGFGRRRILGHSIDYSPAVALRANGYVLWHFARGWFTAGPIGTALAAGGLALAARRWLDGSSVLGRVPDDRLSFQRTGGLLLVGLFVTVPVGNVFFWGNFNVLGTPGDPTDGLVSQFGPIYHFDLLAPLSIFAAIAILAAWQYTPGRDVGTPCRPNPGVSRSERTDLASWLTESRPGVYLSALRSQLPPRLTPEGARTVLVGLFVAGVVVVAVANAAALSAPLERNAAHTDTYERAYEPIEQTSFEEALVFLPTPYGDWQNHPFQHLRNDPDFDGQVVYALDRGPADDFAVIDAYPDRTPYRYSYQGEWTPDANRDVVPKLEPLDIRGGPSLRAETVVGVPDGVERARVRLESGTGNHTEYGVGNPGDSVTVPWSLDSDRATLEEARSGEAVDLDETDSVVLTVTLVQVDGSTLTYRQETTVRTRGGEVEAVWPPDRSVCALVTDCGNEGTYVEGQHREGVFVRTEIESQG